MPDYSEVKDISKKLMDATLRLAALTTPLANAKQVLGWESERRRNLLAKYTVGYLDQDIAAGASEVRARAHPEYREKLNVLIQQSREAEAVVCKADAVRTEWESARSLLSVQRQILGLV